MNRPRILSSAEALDRLHGRVLLVNPPVIDSRYPWVKWNQPLDLLKLGTLLSEEQDCQVKLFDFMLPSPKGRVSRRHSEIDNDLPSDEPTRWHYGRSWESFDDFLEQLKWQDWIPDYVWMTTLTSFWWQAIPLVANRVKNLLGSPETIVSGNYPVLETQHAAQFCPNLDIVIREYVDLAAWSADFALYGDRKLKFCALDIRSPHIIGEIANALKRGTAHFVFFNENLFDDFDACLRPILEEVVSREWELQFHGICGIQTRDFPLDQVQLLADAGFSEVHFEPALDDEGVIDESLYRSVMQACEQAGLVSRRGKGWESRNYYFSGFLWIGRSDDELDRLVWNALKLLQLTGMVIPKPYSPTPGTKDYELLLSQSDWLEPHDISPHRLPFAELNGIHRDDYEDLYRMTAFLNRKVRGHTFDFLGDTYLANIVRESLIGRRWDL